MAFSEKLKQKVRKKSHHSCCICKSIGVEIHHIIPQEENGPDVEENAAPLCPSCHDTYGANKLKRKFIRECRDSWFEICEKRYSNDSKQLDEILKEYVTKEDLERLKKEILRDIGDFAPSKSVFKNILESMFSLAPITEAKLLIKRGNLDQANEVLQNFISANKTSSEAYYLIGYVFGEKNKIDEMLECFEKSIFVDSKYETNINESKKYHWANSFNNGVKCFNEATKLKDRTQADNLFLKAIQEFENSVACDSTSIDAYKNIAYCYINMNEKESAILPFKKVLEIEHCREAYINLGDIYIQKGVQLKKSNESDQAIEYFENAIETLEEGRKYFPDDADILLLLPNSYIAADKHEVALDSFKLGARKNPNNKYYRYNYGSLLLNKNLYPEAEVELKAAIKIDPNYQNAIYNLAVNYVKWAAKLQEEKSKNYKSKFEKSLPFLEKYLSSEAGSKDPATWNLLGKVYANLGMLDSSEDAFNKSLDKST